MLQEKRKEACRQKRSKLLMDRLKEKMQIAATITFILIFGTILMEFGEGVAGESARKRMDKPESEETYTLPNPITSSEAVTTNALEEQQKGVEREYIYYDVPLDDTVQQYIQDTCDGYDFERYDIVVAMIQKESSYCEKIISKTNDYGYMQINKVNHEWLSEELCIDDFLDGKQNILAGVYILSGLYNKYEDIGLSLMAYNCGEAGAKQLWEQGIYSTKYSIEIQEIANGLEMRG